MLNSRDKLVRSGTKGVDEKVDEVLADSESAQAKLYLKATALHKSSLKKGYIESALLTGEDFPIVAEVLEVDQVLLQCYHDFFFDITGFDRLSKIEHIEGVRDKNEMLLKMWALSHGLDFIAWRLGKRISISPVEGLQDLFSTCIYKSKEAMFNSPSSEASKESTKWAKLSTDIARLLKVWVMDSSAARKDLEIAIRTVVPNFGSLEDILPEGAIFETFSVSPEAPDSSEIGI
jgi:hypothetical protein